MSVAEFYKANCVHDTSQEAMMNLINSNAKFTVYKFSQDITPGSYHNNISRSAELVFGTNVIITFKTKEDAETYIKNFDRTYYTAIKTGYGSIEERLQISSLNDNTLILTCDLLQVAMPLICMAYVEFGIYIPKDSTIVSCKYQSNYVYINEYRREMCKEMGNEGLFIYLSKTHRYLLFTGGLVYVVPKIVVLGKRVYEDGKFPYLSN
jgi:hypothetical protein